MKNGIFIRISITLPCKSNSLSCLGGGRELTGFCNEKRRRRKRKLKDIRQAIQ